MSELVDHLADLTGYRDRDVMDVTLVTALREMLRPDALGIYRSVGEAGDERWLTRAQAMPTDTVPTADPAWLPLEQLPRLAEHPMRHDAFRRQAMVEHAGEGHHLCIFPLTTENEAIGVLEIRTAAPLDTAAQRLVASVLRLYRNFHSLLDYSERDTLTGLLNRKTFDESFLKATAGPSAAFGAAVDPRKAAELAGCWLGMIDIDHFKRVNDAFGHLIGDEVLLLLARLIRSSFRSHDQLYRFGGEEFVVLMRCGSDHDAALAFERLRLNTERYAFPQVGRITVSIGFTRVKPGDTPSSAFERADQAVYIAKGRGRNQVQSHADLVASGALADEVKASDVELF